MPKNLKLPPEDFDQECTTVWSFPIHDIDQFCDEMEKVAKEAFRVLKPWKFCAVLMWDTRREKMYQPLAFKVMERFLKVGFALKEDIIKVQHNCKATWFWVQKSKDYNFLLIMYEHLFIFKKLPQKKT